MKIRVIQALVALAVAGVLPAAAWADEPPVHLLQTPNGGIQPQAVVDARGMLHLIYYKGDPAGGDLFYVHREHGKDRFSEPLRVNSQPGSAIAMGTIRGGQLAV